MQNKLSIVSITHVHVAGWMPHAIQHSACTAMRQEKTLCSVPLERVAPSAAVVEWRVQRLEPLHDRVGRRFGGIFISNLNRIILKLLQAVYGRRTRTERVVSLFGLDGREQ